MKLSALLNWVFCAFVILAAIGARAQDVNPFPKAVDSQPAQEFLNWSGFGFLPTGDRTVGKDFRVAGDWSAVEAFASKEPDPASIPWRLKVFVVKRVDRLCRLPDGTVYEEQCALESPDTDLIARSLIQLQAIVAQETHGRLRLVPDVTTESDPVLIGEAPLVDKLSEYLYPRFNGGSYEADDRVYRGPFNSVICFHPVPDPQSPIRVINETPVSFVSAYGPRDFDADGVLAVDLEQIWRDQLKQIARSSGVLGPLASVPAIDPSTGLLGPSQFVPNNDWASVLAGAELDPKLIDQRLRLPVAENQTDPPDEPKLFLQTYEGVHSEVKIASDPDRGSVLLYSETGQARTGGLNFPVPSNGARIIQVGDAPTLSLWCRSSCKDPLALNFWSSEGRVYSVVLGPDRPGPVNLPEADFERDGQWHPLHIDLRPSGFSEISSITLTPTPNSLIHPKITLGPVEYAFAGFKADQTAADPPLPAPKPDPDSPDPWSRARWAHSAAHSAKLAALLKDPDWMVRLNALERYVDKPDPSVEPLLIDDATSSIDGPVSVAALDALWKLNDDTAKDTVSKAVLTDLTEQGKAEAAMLMASTGNPQLVDPLITLSQSRTLATRIADIRALAKIPGTASALVRMSLLIHVDPQMKLEITRTADPDDEYQASKLLWSAVNEPSDAVRAESDLLLIKSKKAENRTAGYNGVKDDSVGVRLILLREFAEHPNEAQRDAIRVAVTDRSARVRAAALAAFAALPKEVTLDEIGAAAQDEHPIVQIALADLMRKKGLKLPTQALDQMKNSPDPQVREAAKDLS